MKHAPMIAVCLLLSANIALAQSPNTVIEVESYSPAPTQMAVLLGDKDRYPLRAATNKWTSTVPWKDSSQLEIRRGALNASFGGDSGGYIPIRLTSLLPSIYLQMRKTAAPKCIKANLDDIKTRSDAEDHLFRTYILARDLFYLTGDDACGSDAKRIVVEAWFIKSYQLATTYAYIDLDKNATDAHRAMFGEASVKEYIERVRAYEIQVLNDKKIAAIKDGSFSQAVKLQDFIVTTTESDTELSKAVLKYQKLTSQQLKRDGDWINLLAKMPDSKTKTLDVKG